jgi:hypothetical protein
MKDKLTKYLKTKDELGTLLESNEPVLFEYHKKLKVEDYNAYLRKNYGLKIVTILYGVQIRF